MEIDLDVKVIQEKLYESFNDFFYLALKQITELDENRTNYKFAVVNMQIALELFLKYYFVRKGEINSIIKNTNSNNIRFIDFSSVLSRFFKVNKWSYGKKRELIRILEIRNEIVHGGLNIEWQKEVVIYLVRCILFIHGTMKAAFGELIIASYKTKFNSSKLWTEGVINFLDDLQQKWDFSIRTCLSCGEYTVISKEVFDIGEPTSNFEDLVCLNCFDYVELDFVNTIIDCYQCYEHSYYVHLLNPQKNGLYIGICSECGTDTWVRKCFVCERFYHPYEVNQIKIDNDKYLCSEDCLECYMDKPKE